MRRIFIVLVICLIISLLVAENNSSIQEKITNYEIPLYERSGTFLADYRTNQTIKQSIRWTNIGCVVGIAGSIPFVYDSRCASSVILLYLGGVGGASFGFIGGSIYGAIHGSKLDKYKKENPDFHLSRYRLGSETGFAYPFMKSVHPNLKYYFNYQKCYSRKFSPTEYRFGVVSKTWVNESSSYEMEGYAHRSFADEVKLDFDVLFNSNRRFANLYYGAGIGYSWGTNEEKYIPEDHYLDTIVKKKNIHGLFIHPLVGLSINFADFFFGRVELDYEISTFYFKAREYNNLPYAGNVHISLSIGSYLF